MDTLTKALTLFFSAHARLFRIECFLDPKGVLRIVSIHYTPVYLHQRVSILIICLAINSSLLGGLTRSLFVTVTL